MNDPVHGDPFDVVGTDRRVGSAATGLRFMKLGIVLSLVGVTLGTVGLALPGFLKLLFVLPALAASFPALLLVVLSEIICLVAPTRWRGRRWVLVMIATQSALGVYAFAGDQEHRRIWSGIGGLIATAAMCAYLSNLATELHRPDVHKLLHRFEINSMLGGLILVILKELRPPTFFFTFLLGLGIIFVSRGVRAYWATLTELRITLLAADAIVRSLPTLQSSNSTEGDALRSFEDLAAD